MAQVNAIQIWFVEPLVVLRHFKRFHILPSDMLPGIAFFLSWSCKKKTYMLFGGWSWIDAYIYSFFLARSARVFLTIPLMTESSASMESLWFAMNRIQNRSSWSSTMCCLRVWVAIHFVHGRMRRLAWTTEFFCRLSTKRPCWADINYVRLSSWKASRNIQESISRNPTKNQKK